MNQQKADPVKKRRNEAIARARARLAARQGGNDLWRVILSYSGEVTGADVEDRAKGLVLGSILEQGIETAIISHCVIKWDDDAAQTKLFGGPDGSMSFALKIKLGFALGVYGPNSRDDLEIIRNVRNLFAHDRSPLSFSDSVVGNLCKEITWINRVGFGGLMGTKPETAHDIYIQTVRYYYPYLTVGVGQPITYSDELYSEMYN